MRSRTTRTFAPAATVLVALCLWSATVQAGPSSSPEALAVSIESDNVVWTLDRVGTSLKMTPLLPGAATEVRTTGDQWSQLPPFPEHRVLNAGARATENVAFVGHIGGAVEAVFTTGDRAYVGEGLRMVILNITDPTSPVVLGKTEPLDGVVQGIVAAPGRVHEAGAGIPALVYVAAGDGGLRVIDVSDPSTPQEVGFVEPPIPGTDAASLAIDGDYAYVGMNGVGLLIIDITDPQTPFIVSSLDPPGTWAGAYFGLTKSGDYIYAADWGGPGLRVIDVTDPDIPVEVGYWEAPSSPFDVALDEVGPYAHAPCGGGLRVVDITDPTNPFEVGFLATQGPALAVAAAGSHVYVGEHFVKLHVINVSDPSSPFEEGLVPLPAKPDKVVVDGSYAFVADIERGLRVIDVDNPTAPFEAGFYEGPGSAFGVAVQGTYAYTANNKGGFWAVDVSDPAVPAGAGVYHTPGYAGNVDVEGDYACVADNFMGLRVINIEDPTDPYGTGSYNTPGSGLDVDMEGDYAYVADFNAGLQIVDISTPSAPFPAGSAPIPSYAMGVAKSGDHAYVTAQSAGLRVVDVTDPGTPFETGYAITPDARDVTVDGHLAFVADYDTGLRVIDVTDPDAPAHVGTSNTPGLARGVAVDEALAYVADSYAGLRIIDRTTLQEVGFYETPTDAIHVDVANGYIYLATHRSGLLILSYGATAVDTGPVADPPAPVRIGASPNPFSAGLRTRIAFSLIEETAVSLTIVDITGRRVRTLRPWQSYEPGSHEVLWDGRDDRNRSLGGGVYFLRLDSDKGPWQHRFVLLR